MALHPTRRVLLRKFGPADSTVDAVEVDIRKICAKVSDVRKDVVFDVLTSKVEHSPWEPFIEIAPLGYGPRNVHGLISYGSPNSVTGSWGGDINISLHRLTAPSPDILSTQLAPPDGVADLDLKILCLDHTTTALEGSVLTASPDGIEHLTRVAVAVAAWDDQPSRFTVVRDETQLETVTAQCSASLAVHSMVAPDRISHMSLNHAMQTLCEAPASLNGILLVEKSSVNHFTRWAACIEGVQTSRASFSPSVPNVPDFHFDVHGGAGEQSHNAIDMVIAIQGMFQALGLPHEADAVSEALRRTLDRPENVGSDIRPITVGGSVSDSAFVDTVTEHLAFFLEAINSNEAAAASAAQYSDGDSCVVQSRGSLNLIQKIIMNASTNLTRAEISTGQYVCAHVDWVLTSELLWAGMEKTYDQMGRPRPYRNDRVWLAIDHTVDPRTKHFPKQKQLIERSDKFRDEAKIINYLPANTSIMHTDFTRDKAQPGTIVVGSDSHTCSAGSMGALAIGFGAADVVMPLVTGQTWLRVPEVCRINFVGKSAYGVTGKDVVLHVLGLFKRNTIAFQRAVEYGGPSLDELSMDARFAIANMTTEFGGMGACFEADQTAAQWISKRRSRKDRAGARYFRPDANASYAEVRTVDLSHVAHTMAIYPNPDDVVPMPTKNGMALDGCFIGACTTTEEELILAALILDAGLRSNAKPIPTGKRRVTPGSLIITRRLEALGLLDIYRKAGFDIGAPGCSYCVGINDVDVAQEGEVWLSSQNRNFKNRMGKGSIGNISSAAAVAASSFDMRVTDPRTLIAKIDREQLEKMLHPHGRHSRASQSCVLPRPLPIVEPQPRLSSSVEDGGHALSKPTTTSSLTQHPKDFLSGRIQRFGDNIDTDAIIPAEFMPGIDNADLGSHCFQYWRPEFRERVKAGSSIVVAGVGFGSGSSREDAVRALLGVGVQAVIAKSFAFIYERNQLNMGLFSAIIVDDEFYKLAQEGADISIDRASKTITVAERAVKFTYQHSVVEERILDAGGIVSLYEEYGRDLFHQMTNLKSVHLPEASGRPTTVNPFDLNKQAQKLDW